MTYKRVKLFGKKQPVAFRVENNDMSSGPEAVQVAMYIIEQKRWASHIEIEAVLFNQLEDTN